MTAMLAAAIAKAESFVKKLDPLKTHQNETHPLQVCYALREMFFGLAKAKDDKSVRAVRWTVDAIHHGWYPTWMQPTRRAGHFGGGDRGLVADDDRHALGRNSRLLRMYASLEVRQQKTVREVVRICTAKFELPKWMPNAEVDYSGAGGDGWRRVEVTERTEKEQLWQRLTRAVNRIDAHVGPRSVRVTRLRCGPPVPTGKGVWYPEVTDEDIAMAGCADAWAERRALFDAWEEAYPEKVGPLMNIGGRGDAAKE